MADNPDSKRRDFLQLSTISIGAVGTAAFIWPFLKSMNPAEDTLALGTTEVDVSLIEEGQSITCLLYTSPSPRDGLLSRMPSSA